MGTQRPRLRQARTPAPQGPAPPSAGPRRRTALISDFGVAATFLLLIVAGEIVLTVLSAHQRAAVIAWASTNVANLHHHPIPALVFSAFLPTSSLLAWAPIIALAMFGANRAVGNLRLALICAAGHVIGTAVSEGIVAYRIGHHELPQAWAHITDVGASYVVVSAIVVAVIAGSWPARIAALADFAILVLIGHIFADLTRLHVAPVGHLTAMTVATILAVVLRRHESEGGHPR